MHSIPFLVFLLTFVSSTFAQNTTDPVTTVSTTNPYSSTSGFFTTTSAIALASPGTLTPESQCSGNTSLTGFCPACDSSIIPYGESGAYEVTCNKVYADVTYYADIHNATVIQCIQACRDLEHCYAPVVSPDGRCLLAVGGPGYNVVLAGAKGYAALQPRFTGAISPTTSPGSGHFSTATLTTMKNTTRHTSSTVKHAATCQASAIACPHCDGAHVRDPLGKTHEVLCGTQLNSSQHYAIQQWLTPEGCMTECDNYEWCLGSSFWPEGNCELARGVDFSPQHLPGHTAFIPVLLNVGTSVQRPTPSSTRSTTTTSSAHRTGLPVPEKCNRDNISCPACAGLEVEDGLNRKYCVRCDLQPTCTVMKGLHRHDTPNSCMEQCDEDHGCLAAIFDAGTCALCKGSIEHFSPWVLPHQYAVFMSDEAVGSDD